MENDEETLLLIQGINRQSSEELEDCMYDVVPLLATKLESNNSDIIRSSMLVLEKMARRCNSAKEMTLYINGAIIKDKNGPKYYQTYYLAHLFVNILSFRLTTGSQMIALGFIPNLIRRILRPFKGWYTNIKAFNDQGDNDDSTDEYQDEKEQKEVEIKEKKQYLNEDSESELGETSEEDLSECSDLSEDEQQQQQKEKDQQQMKVDDESEDTFDINSFTSFYFENQWRKSQSIRDGIPIVRSSIKGVSPLFDVTLEVIAKSLGSNIKDIVSSLINTGIQPIFTPIPNISAEKENDLRLKCKTALWYMMLHLLRSMTLSMREVELRETGWRLLKKENIGTSSSSSQASSKSPSFINSVFYNRSDELKEILNDLQRNDLKEEINDFQKDIKTINSKYKLKKPSKNEIEKQEQDKLHKAIAAAMELLISKSVILSSRAIILVQAATKKFIQEGFDPIHFSFSRNARGCAQSLLDHQTNHPFFTLLYSHQLQNLDICEQTPIYASAEVIIKDRKKQRQNFASNNEQKSDGQISSVNIWNKEVDRIFEILGLHSELVQVSSCFLKYATNLISYESQHPFIDTALSFVSLLPQSQLASRNQILLINSLLLSLIPALNVSSQAASLNAALTGGKTKKEVVADQRLNSLIPDILTKFKSKLLQKMLMFA
ncbi:MAG: hypothetical protein EZS28_027348 [Streblomastix strix]|uniref:Uncharacterized protein n=1 Tax=Streblomastix strix TaxID=222440 RepID=A0A5J4V4W5_9EUKA|nr:MAG: hypothetical protein EZS28_027348 [Streblomastix strix]